MNEQENKLRKQIMELVVDDYFTPNIKAEIILDTLLTPYIEEILKDQCGIDAVFLTKEMSIKKRNGNNRGPKVDYVLTDKTEKRIYLVELKTTKSSINEDQAEVYRTYCQNKYFGEVLGYRLLSILNKNKTFFPLNCLKNEHWGDQTLKDAFQEIIFKHFDLFEFSSESDMCKECKKLADAEKQKKWCVNCARKLIYENKWTQKGNWRSRKYLHTLGQLVDYLNKNETLWDKKMKVFYLTPTGDDAPKDFTGLSLEKFADSHVDSNDSCAKLLSDIIKKIVLPTKKERNNSLY